jgi:hypothetical protein
MPVSERSHLEAMGQETELVVVYPPDLDARTRTSLRAIVAAISTSADRSFASDPARRPVRIELIFYLADHLPGSDVIGHCTPSADRTCARIEIAIGGERVDLDSTIITLAHEFGHVLVDRDTRRPVEPDGDIRLGLMIADELGAERHGWKILRGVPVPSAEATIRYLADSRIVGCERGIAERITSRTSVGPDVTAIRLADLLAYAIGAGATAEDLCIALGDDADLLAGLATSIALLPDRRWSESDRALVTALTRVGACIHDVRDAI